MTPAERAAAVSKRMEEFFAKAAAGQYDQLEPVLTNDLEPLFSATVSGFREILLVILHARILDPTYKASLHFYDCHPRALYEGPIRSELRRRGIPHRQSGPLNIAKATEAINSAWAARRELAPQVVRLVERIESMPRQQLENLAIVVHKLFLDNARKTKALNVVTVPQSDVMLLSILTTRLIDGVADAGNTPQRIIGLMLDAYHQDLGSGLQVIGHEHRASVTSTTSNKAGDIAEVRPNGSVALCYEVTVKAFGQNRVEECSDSLTRYNEGTDAAISEVTVICRREDAHPDATEDDVGPFIGKLEYGALTFLFVDIYHWITLQLLRMAVTARLRFYERLAEYVAEPNTAEKVKRFWKEHHERLAELAEG